MKKLIIPAAIIITVLFQVACKKDIPAPNTSIPCANCLPPGPNKPPKVYAGVDQNIKLPVDSILLNGVGTDDDGTVVSYLWTKLSGPTVTIDSANRPQAIVKNLVQGVYDFELTVTDNLGAIGKDHLYVTVSKADEILFSNWFSLDTSSAAYQVYYDSSYFISSHLLFPNLETHAANMEKIIFTKLVSAGIPEYKRHDGPLQISIQLPERINPFVFEGYAGIEPITHIGTYFYQELYNTGSNPSYLHNVAFIKAAELLIRYQYRCFLIPQSTYNSQNINWDNYLEVVTALNITP